MRAVQRAIAATALGLPLLLAGPGMAMAHDAKPPKPPKKPHVHQSQSNDTDQSNTNSQPIYQINVGGHGDQSALAWNDQANSNSTDQDQEVEHGK